jgi:GNAT superfamily N-acetyltransferase
MASSTFTWEASCPSTLESLGRLSEDGQTAARQRAAHVDRNRVAVSTSGERLNVFLEVIPRRKRELQERLTARLPQWFGLQEPNAKYAMLAEVLDGYIAEIDGARQGLLLLKYHSRMSAEVYWMGVDPTCHRKGVGRTLMKAAIDDARKRGVRYLFVATLHPEVEYEPFLRTRCFYEAMGFVYVHAEHFPADPENPIAYYLKQL